MKKIQLKIFQDKNDAIMFFSINEIDTENIIGMFQNEKTITVFYHIT
jgi:hypothetical protein